MTDQPALPRFQVILESALQHYERKAGVTLASSEDSLVVRLQHCHSIDDITALLEEKVQVFNDLRQRDRILKSIKATVSILTPISSVISITDGTGLVCQKVLKARLTFLTIFTEITPTCESNTFYSRYPPERVYHF
jgi:hypothetical protein